MTKEIEDEVLRQWEHHGWPYAELFLKSKRFNSEEIEQIYDRLKEGKSLHPYDTEDTQ